MKRHWLLYGAAALALLLAVVTGLTVRLSARAEAQGLGPQDELEFQAPVGTAFTYQGRLTDDGSPANGPYDFEFKLYDGSGTQVGSTVTVDDKDVADGLFTVELDFGSDIFTGDARYLEISVRPGSGGAYTTLLPRQTLTPAPYALALPGLWTQQSITSTNLIGGYNGNSVTAGVMGATVGGGGTAANHLGDPAPNHVTDDYGTVSGGMANTADWAATVGGGWGNTASGSCATVGGGWGNAASGGFATVAGGTGSTASASYATVGGGANSASGYGATVGGGIGNTASGDYATVGGGYDNEASDDYATVGGGEGNEASGYYATVGGGSGNVVTGTYATVGGGYSNEANDYYATVGGGGGNTASDAYATVGGGNSNIASGNQSTVGGGSNNTATNVLATIGGGYLNVASGNHTTVGGGYSNEASSYYATVGGGYDNTASGDRATVGGGSGNVVTGTYATVGGGSGNVAGGSHATVPGGYLNIASGDSSFAAGDQAQATHSGAFVWSSAASTSSWADNTFTVRAHGGARFYSGSGINTGVELASGGGSWGSLSDRNAKENFADVNHERLLDTLATMPIQTWNLRAQPPEMRHIGPVAQDFNGTFGYLFGEVESPIRINTMDAVGVSLAAAQGLYQLSQEQAARIEELETENGALQAENTAQQEQIDDLETRVAALEAAVGDTALARPIRSGLLPGAGALLMGLVVVWLNRRDGSASLSGGGGR